MGLKRPGRRWLAAPVVCAAVLAVLAPPAVRPQESKYLGQQVTPEADQNLGRARDLLEEGRHGEARAAFDELLERAKTAGTKSLEMQSLLGLAEVAVAEGRYVEAKTQADSAAQLARELGDLKAESDATNSAALALAYQGEHAAALLRWHRCLELDRQRGDAEGQVTRLTNIGGIHYFQGHYSAALRAYQEALRLVDEYPATAWAGRRRQIATVNLAALFQRLGRHQKALDLYLELRHQSVEMQASEQARMLANIGALYRHLGDPVKALEIYSQAEKLYQQQPHARGEINLLTNTGIAQGFDLGRTNQALETFARVERLAAASADRRKGMHSRLYRGEIYRRAGRLDQARGELTSALEAAKVLGAAEEQWKALFGLGQVAEASADPELAERLYSQAIEEIESVRARLEAPSLKTEFMAEKSDVYDALIELRLRAPKGAEAPGEPSREDAEYVLSLVERQQARLFQELLLQRLLAVSVRPEHGHLARMRELHSEMTELWRDQLNGEGLGVRPDPKLQRLEQLFLQAETDYYTNQAKPLAADSVATLSQIQASLGPSEVLLVVWAGRQMFAVLWVAREDWGLSRGSQAAEVGSLAGQLRDALARRTAREWRGLSEQLGMLLLADIDPLRDGSVRHATVVAHSALAGVPFEVLAFPESSEPEPPLLIERVSVSYLPSPALVPRSRLERRSRWYWPWQRYLVALADPLGEQSGGREARLEPLGALPYAREEVRAIARALAGAAETHIGDDATKEAVFQTHPHAPAVLHLATHAIADLESVERSRILLAAAPPDSGADYLFQAEVFDLDLQAVDLVTLSACETERGRVVEGEGEQAFSRAFLAAGAGSTLTTLWRVDDHSTAAFMSEFYGRLAGGETKADALRQVKLQFLRLDGSLGHPYFWAPYVLAGAASAPLPGVLTWPMLWALAGAAFAAVGSASWLLRRNCVMKQYGSRRSGAKR